MTGGGPGKGVAVFFTGGTSGMRPLEGAPGVAPAHAFDRLMADLSSVVREADLRGVQWADIPSPHMTPMDMFRLAKDVEAVLAEPGIVGAVVIHGTDVMEESSFMADLVIDSPRPVVFTGAMRYLGELGYDGLRNLLFGIKAAVASRLNGLGSFVLMADRLFSAREVTKVHSTGIDPFDSPGLGPMGFVAEDGVHVVRGPSKRLCLKPERIEPNVDLIKFSPGMDARFIRASRAGGAAGLVIEGFGAGNIPPGVVPEIEAVVQEGRPVVLTTRCLKGGVRPIYGYPGGAADLEQRGVILGGRFPGQRARILLTAALGLTRDIERIRRIFQEATE
ncbi:MAG: asparaginase [Thermodesulfobacteriota bacterium]